MNSTFTGEGLRLRGPPWPPGCPRANLLGLHSSLGVSRCPRCRNTYAVCRPGRLREDAALPLGAVRMLSRFPTATRRRLSGSFFLPRSQAENSGRAQTPCQARPPPRADSYRPGRRIQGLTLKSRKHRGFGMKCPHACPASGPVHVPPAGALVPSSSLTFQGQQPPGPVAHSAPDLALQRPYLHTYGTACSLPVSRVHSQLPKGGSSLGSSLNPPMPDTE